MWRFTILLIVLIVLLIGFGGFGAFAFITKGTTIAFNDIVMFVIALVGLLMALASIGIFYGVRRLLEEDIRRRIGISEKCARDRAQYQVYHQLATSFLRFYEDKGNLVFLNQTIAMAKKARVAILEAYETLKEEEPSKFKKEKARYEEYMCHIFNNLAFALAMRGESKDTTMAHSLAEYVKERIKHYPESETDYLETLAYVLWKLPKTPQDKKRGLELIKNILKRPDVSPEDKIEYGKRYDISN